MRENVFKYLLLFLLGCLEDVSGFGPYQQPVVVPQSQSQPVYASYNQPQQGYYQFPHRPTWPLYNQPQQVHTTQQPRQVVYGYNQPQQVYQQPQYYQSSGTTNYQQQLSKPHYYYQGSQPASSSHQSQTPIVQQKPVYQYQYYRPQQVQPTPQTYGYGYVAPSTSSNYVQPTLYNHPVSATQPQTYPTTYPQPKPTITYVPQPVVQSPRGQYYYPPQPLTAVQSPRGQYYYPPQPLSPSPPVYVQPPPVTSPPVPHTHVRANIHAHGSPVNPLPLPHAHVATLTHAHPLPSDSVRVLSYNLFGSSTLKEHPQKAYNVFKAIRLANPDILGAQEVDGMEQVVVANLGQDYAVAGPANAGNAIFFRTSVFNLEAHGFVKLNEMDHIVTPNLKTQFNDHHSLISGTVAFARFNHVSSGRIVDVFNTHLCLCDEELLLASAKVVIDTIFKHRRPGSRIILTGDFNCEDGWENSKPVKYFKGLLGDQPIPLVDTFRFFNGNEVDGTTVPGKNGKKDYVMVDKGAVVRNAWIDRNWADLGHASNHWPVGAIIDLGQ